MRRRMIVAAAVAAATFIGGAAAQTTAPTTTTHAPPAAARTPAPAATHAPAPAASTGAPAAAPGAPAASTGAPAASAAAGAEPPIIEPQNALERTFVAAMTNEEMRPVFRHQILDSQVAIAMTSEAEGAAPREFRISETITTTAVFTSAARLAAVLGDNMPRVVVSGREALQRLRGKNIAINPGLSPVVTLEPDDIDRWLGASAGPTQ